MFENIRNVITRLPMDRVRPTWVVTSHHVPDMSAMMPSNDALYIQQLWASGDRTREPILMKFGNQTQIRTTVIVT